VERGGDIDGPKIFRSRSRRTSRGAASDSREGWRRRRGPARRTPCPPAWPSIRTKPGLCACETLARTVGSPWFGRGRRAAQTHRRRAAATTSSRTPAPQSRPAVARARGTSSGTGSGVGLCSSVPVLGVLAERGRPPKRALNERRAASGKPGRACPTARSPTPGCTATPSRPARHACSSFPAPLAILIVFHG